MKRILAAALIVLPALAWAAPLSTVTAGKLSWGTSPTFAPFEFQRDGQSVGFDVDMVAELARRLQLQSAMLGMDFAGIIPAVQAQRIDLAVSGMYITPAREEVIDFIPYLRIGDQMVVRGGAFSTPTYGGFLRDAGLRAAHREGVEATTRADHIGFRCAR